MKVIQVVGRSNSGKTYFIHRLLERMTVISPGKVGVIKHLGHHTFDLEEGKDTTTHYEHGAECVAGVDAEKTVLTIRNDELVKSLEILCDLGMEYAIIEGFKSYGFKKIVKGELESGECLLRDPTVDEVIASIDKFDDYYTLNGLVSELKNNGNVTEGCFIATCSGAFDNCRKDSYVAADLPNEIKNINGISDAGIRLKKDYSGTGKPEILIAVASDNRKDAVRAIDTALSCLFPEAE